MKESACRICNSHDGFELPIGVYADFFALRVDVSKDEFALYSFQKSLSLPQQRHSLQAKLKRFLSRHGLKLGGHKQFFRTTCRLCGNCESIYPCHEYSEAELAALYRDYRSPTYNADRIAVEPSYGRIAQLVGRDEAELKVRNDGVSQFLAPHLKSMESDLAIDLGGSDGRFIPRCLIEHFQNIHILDASDLPVWMPAWQGRISKVSEPAGKGYSLLTCMHVLEHVGDPRAFLLRALEQLKPGAFLYLEVPLESTEELRAQFRERTIDVPFYIHEHINLYTPASIPRMISSIRNIELAAAQESFIDMGWTRGAVGRYLARLRA
jgi:hypothetical protein